MTSTHQQTTTTGMASPESLQQLHGLVCEALQAQLNQVRPVCPAEVLGVAVAFLAHHSAFMNRPLTVMETKQLIDLKELHAVKVIEAMRADNPKASTIAESRHLLAMLSSQASLRVIDTGEMPFKT